MLTPEQTAFFKKIGAKVKVSPKEAEKSPNLREDFRVMVISLFIEAMESNDKERLKRFFQEPIMLDISATYKEQSLLYHAMVLENYDAIAMLINNGAELKKGELTQFKLKFMYEDSKKSMNASRDRYTVKLVDLLQEIKANDEPRLNPVSYTKELLKKLALSEENYYDRYTAIQLTTFDGKRIDFDLSEVFSLTSESDINDHIFKIIFKNLATKEANADKLGYLQDKLSSEQSLCALASGYITFADLERMVGDITDQAEIDRRFDFLTSPETLAMLANQVVSMDEIVNENLYSREAIVDVKKIDFWEKVDPDEIDETKHTWKEIFSYLMHLLSNMVQTIPHQFTSAYHHMVTTDKPEVKHIETVSKYADEVSNNKDANSLKR